MTEPVFYNYLLSMIIKTIEDTFWGHFPLNYKYLTSKDQLQYKALLSKQLKIHFGGIFHLIINIHFQRSVTSIRDFKYENMAFCLEINMRT